MSELQKVSAQEAREKVETGQAKLVCAYDDAEKCQSMLLEGAISLHEFYKELPQLSYDQEIIFYCA